MELAIKKTEKEKTISKNIELLTKRAQIEIWDETSAIEATDLLKFVNTQLKATDEERKWLVQPINDHVKKINDRFKEYSNPLNEILASLKSKLKKYTKEQERIAEAQALIARQKEEELRKKNEKLEQAGIAPIVLEKKSSVIAGPVRGNFGTSSMTKRWTYKVLDIGLVPTEFLELNSSAVGKAIREGRRYISGLEIYQEESISIR